ncbi:hypothetical protein SDC9_160166 [bioreactor metagenome]|uniref:Uncharacterized protein n=1 Tax=bioreactor metagenome TaxID=1076179 RepID=A0A645FGU5_9ZZZZ
MAIGMNESNGMLQTPVKQRGFCPVMPVNHFALLAVFNLMLKALKFRPLSLSFPQTRNAIRDSDLAGNRFHLEDIIIIRMLMTDAQWILWCATVRVDRLCIMPEQIHCGGTVKTQ